MVVVAWWRGFWGGRERGVKVKRELEKRFVSGSIQTLLGLVFHVMWNGEVAVSTGWKGRSLGKELRDRNLASWRKKKKKRLKPSGGHSDCYTEKISRYKGEGGVE